MRTWLCSPATTSTRGCAVTGPPSLPVTVTM